MSANEEKSLNDKIEELESVLMKKEQDIIELKQINMKTDSLYHNIKEKNK